MGFFDLAKAVVEEGVEGDVDGFGSFFGVGADDFINGHFEVDDITAGGAGFGIGIDDEPAFLVFHEDF